MKIALYPDFNEVFIDQTLKGIFYPLCSVKIGHYPDQIFHFVSSNGLWMNEDFQTEYNTSQYTLFEIIDHKYKFHGDVRLYQGFEHAQTIFDALENDFLLNGAFFLESKLQTDAYIEQQKHKFHLEFHEEFDADYYLQTFYEFSINKLNFNINNEFAAFRGIIDGWPDGNCISPIVYDKATTMLQGILNHYDKPDIQSIDVFKAIGAIIGCEFFTDGNDTILHFNGSNKILCVNFYS